MCSAPVGTTSLIFLLKDGLSQHLMPWCIKSSLKNVWFAFNVAWTSFSWLTEKLFRLHEFHGGPYLPSTILRHYKKKCHTSSAKVWPVAIWAMSPPLVWTSVIFPFCNGLATQREKYVFNILGCVLYLWDKEDCAWVFICVFQVISLQLEYSWKSLETQSTCRTM
jgi:hypothetical protein